MNGQAASTVFFYVFAAVSVALAVATVISRRILRAAVALMGVLATSAAFYVMLDAEFLAGVQILVYVGGIVILLVYAVMLTRSSELIEDRPSGRRRGAALAVSTLFFVAAAGAFVASRFETLRPGALTVSGTTEIGRRLLDQGSTGYVLPFELISLLLLSVLIGGVVIARTNPDKGEDAK
ncbi:MAG: NADH-quinone oxidoreductase subunit J [Oligoflexia bacterium]|nr:NADH-quinone oxidoreductase subunit J [Oligoflexia bacterium]